MKKRDKVTIVIAVICMMLTVLFGYTYAYWIINKVQTGVNVVESGCFRIEFTEGDDIDLKNAIPMLDKDGLQTKPYTFTIENVCDTFAKYQINLETFDVEAGKDRLPDSYVKANLKKGNGNKFHNTLTTDKEVEPTITGATNAYKLAEGTLKNGNVHTYNLRLWMDENVSYEDTDSMNAYFNGKISVIFTADIDPFAESGMIIQRPGGVNYYTYFWNYNSVITKLEFQNKLEPISDATENWDMSTTHDGSIMAYLVPTSETVSQYDYFQGKYVDKDTYELYIQGKGGIKLNPNSSNYFSGFSRVSEFNGLEYLDSSFISNMSSMFSGFSDIEHIDFTLLDTSNVTDMSYLFYGSTKLKTIDLSSWDTSNVTNMEYMFATNGQGGPMKLENLDLSNFDTSNVTNMDSMFSSVNNLIELDVSNWDTSNVTNMSNMFSSCRNLIKLDTSNWDTSNVTNMSNMFSYCKKLIKLDISNWDTSNVTKMDSIFVDCEKLQHVDIKNWDISNVTSISSMFSGCSELTELDLSNFDTSKVVYFNNLFANTPKLSTTINILSENASYYSMFKNAATQPGAQIIINYLSINQEMVDDMLATKSDTSNVIKGSMLDELTAHLYDITNDNSNITLNRNKSYKNGLITLTSIVPAKVVASFKINGTLVNGGSFTMPDENVTITDVVLVDGVIVESEHQPYANNIDNEVYYENTFDGASSITVELTYQTESQYYDWLYLYTSPTTIYQNKKYGDTTLKTEIITIDSDYLKIVFRTNGSGNNYYGFKAIIIPNYD